MQIVEYTPDRLILLEFVLILACLLMTALGWLAMQGEASRLSAPLLFGAVLCCAAFGRFVRQTKIILDRPKGIAVLQTNSLWRSRKITHALPRIIRADLQPTTSRSSEGRAERLHRLVLVLTDGTETLPLILDHTGSLDPGRIVETVNDWLGYSTANNAPNRANPSPSRTSAPPPTPNRICEGQP